MTVFERIENLRKSTGISQGKLKKNLVFPMVPSQNGNTAPLNMTVYKKSLIILG